MSIFNIGHQNHTLQIPDKTKSQSQAHISRNRLKYLKHGTVQLLHLVISNTERLHIKLIVQTFGLIATLCIQCTHVNELPRWGLWPTVLSWVEIVANSPLLSALDCQADPPAPTTRYCSATVSRSSLLSSRSREDSCLMHVGLLAAHESF